MEALRLVVYQNDPNLARNLAGTLSKHFNSVDLAGGYEEVRPAVVRSRAEVLVLDVESSQTGEIARLHEEFPQLCIVATHRLADDKLWTEALDKGAADVCEPRNEDVVRAVQRGRGSNTVA